MRKYPTKKSKRGKKDSKNNVKKNIIDDNVSINSNEIDYDKLADAMVDAYHKITKQREYEEELTRKNNQNQWYDTIGYKDFSKEKNCLKRKVKILANNFRILRKVLFIKESKIMGDTATTLLIQLLLSLMFSLFELIP